jgi:integrase
MVNKIVRSTFRGLSRVVRICKDNDLRRIRLHDLRHTTATLLKALGVPPKDAHITTTNQIYTHADEASKREALSKLNKLLGGDDT